MAEKILSEPAASQAVDDFKLVEGIGPAVEKSLHAAGILTYTQLASMKPEKLARLLDGMIGYSPKRIKEQDWSGQARTMANKVGQTFAGENYEGPNNSLHYASYTVELLLDRNNQVRRTRIMHVQTQQETTWAGWNTDRLRGFLVDSGQLQIPSELGEAAKTMPAPARKLNHEASRHSIPLRGSTKIAETQLFNQAGQPLGVLIPSYTPFKVHLVLDLSQVDVPKGERLSYDATIYLRKMGKGGHFVT